MPMAWCVPCGIPNRAITMTTIATETVSFNDVTITAIVTNAVIATTRRKIRGDVGARRVSKREASAVIAGC